MSGLAEPNSAPTSTTILAVPETVIRFPVASRRPARCLGTYRAQGGALAHIEGDVHEVARSWSAPTERDDKRRSGRLRDRSLSPRRRWRSRTRVRGPRRARDRLECRSRRRRCAADRSRDPRRLAHRGAHPHVGEMEAASTEHRPGSRAAGLRRYRHRNRTLRAARDVELVKGVRGEVGDVELAGARVQRDSKRIRPSPTARRRARDQFRDPVSRFTATTMSAT